jgi:hypothetical protein
MCVDIPSLEAYLFINAILLGMAGNALLLF